MARRRITSKSIVASRSRAWMKQGGKCHVCEVPIWLKDKETLTGFVNRLSKAGVQLTDNAQIKNLEKTHLCTLDHYVPRSKGGQNNDTRNTALCPSCNTKRDTQDYETFRTIHRWNLGFR